MSDETRRLVEVESYTLGMELMLTVLRRFTPFGPEFRLPPPDLALIASLADIGLKLACNGPARSVVVEVMAASDRLEIGDYPTAMMLRVALEELRIPIKWVPLAELELGPSFMLRKSRISAAD